MKLFTLCMMSWVFVSTVQAQAIEVMRWSEQESLLAQSVSMKLQGVIVRLEGQDLPLTVPWYDFRSTNRSIPEYRAWQDVHDAAWRAHARLARGDYSGAGKLYEQLREQFLWKVGPESVDVSLGLAQTRLDAGDQVGAVIPFLSWNSALGENNYETIIGQDGLDAQYGVLIDLPPVFHGLTESPQVSVPEALKKHHRVENLASIYSLAMNNSTHQTPEAERVLSEIARSVRNQDRRDAGVAFMLEMATAMYHPDKQRRSASRNDLERRKRTGAGTWVEVWSRLAVGSSLLSENETVLNELGAIELIHIIVRLVDISPPLARLAGEIVQEYLSNTNQSQWGAQLLLHVQESSMNTMLQPYKDTPIND